jgi:putative transposase
MPYWRLFYHAVWGTKGRMPVIADSVAADIHRVITSKAQELGALVYAVGGMEDHVHVVASIPPRISIAEFVGQIKGTSAHVTNHVLLPEGAFTWQTEYGVVSFGGKKLDTVVKYVLEQRQRHQEKRLIPLLERLDEGSRWRVSRATVRESATRQAPGPEGPG